ncbi:TIGR03960 family B12-binding radical SAM protein [Candidatus Cyanaurora vandensis]|uniref:TIGR03960 family B12-binding radical SAM protein n=1 Tax=Candidatus Cyanaurora vandensis TaxID=2714958 RepID=UPI002580E1EF|nr:TIGR03960 family B12-binding radical SAM protein [Candidatus Cyanaurora vandensis]
MPTIALDTILSAEIQTPGRYLGNERGAFHKPWADCTVRWVLTYPELYEVGASNLGHIILYNILNTQPRQLCDRAYLPGTDFAERLRTTQTPLFAVESRRGLRDFDLIGFSLAYELGATNVLEMLDLSQIPLFAAERGAGDPLIFAGGPTATSNPEPYWAFFDFFVLGDGEEVLPEIGLVLEEGKQAGLSREELLLDLAQVPGVYVPQFYQSTVPPRPLARVPERVLRRVAPPLPRFSIGLVPLVQTVHDRLAIEVRRGCTRGCRFCQPGMLTRPARDVDPAEVVQTIESGLQQTGYSEFSLLSLSCSDYLSLNTVGATLQNDLAGQGISLSLPSQRVDRFSPELAQIIGGTRRTGLTFAPEAGTQRLRDVINKGLTNEELLRGVKTAYQEGWDAVKLYFMIGLPTETDEDVLGIAETVAWLQQECREPGRRKLECTLTISNFTPKPHTPFQWHTVSNSEFERKHALLKRAFRGLRGVKVNYTDYRLSALEDVAGRAGREFAGVVLRAWQLGAGLAGFADLDRAWASWNQALAEHGLTADVTGPALDAPLPWDFIDTGIAKDWLQRDYEQALAAQVVPDCSFDSCSHCGICGEDFGSNIVLAPAPMPPVNRDKPLPTQVVQRLRVRFGKLGELRFLGHLDLVRLWERGLRRAGLPIAFTEGFHPLPRVTMASALALGMTSSGEWVDFELSQVVEPESFRAQLAAQVPLPLYEVMELPVRADSCAKLLDRASYTLTLVAEVDLDWEKLVADLLADPDLSVQRLHKKTQKIRTLPARAWLLALALVEGAPSRAIITYSALCRNDGTVVRPSDIATWFSTLAQTDVTPQAIHRDELGLA